MKNAIRILTALAVLATAGMASAAVEAWQYTFTPYLWALGVDGDITAGPASVPVDVKFLDAVKDLDMGGMLSAEARNGAWGILADGTYLKLSADADTALGKIEVEFKQWTLQGAVVYRVLDAGSTVLDLGAGGRYLSMDITLNTPAATPDRNASKDLVDPILVARLSQHFTEKFYGVLVGDIGGFGVSSDLTWQAIAAAGYAFNDTVSMLAGYRALGYDFEKDEVSLDLVEHGIVIGLQFSL